MEVGASVAAGKLRDTPVRFSIFHRTVTVASEADLPADNGHSRISVCRKMGWRKNGNVKRR